MIKVEFRKRNKVEEKKKKKTEPINSIISREWIPSEGVVILGETEKDGAGGRKIVRTKYIKKEEALVDKKYKILTMRLIKDYLETGTEANPVNLSWNHYAGSDNVFSAEMAVRFDFSNVYFNNRDIIPHFGMDYEKNDDKDSKKDIRQIYAGVSKFVDGGPGFLRP